MIYSFLAKGHPNITAKQRNTVEITKETELGIEGDCIIGVNADFSLDKIKEFCKNSQKAKIILECSGIAEEINFVVDPDFDDPDEIVIRKTNFKSKRTLGLLADKAAKDLDRVFIEKLKDGTAIKVTLMRVENGS